VARQAASPRPLRLIRRIRQVVSGRGLEPPQAYMLGDEHDSTALRSALLTPHLRRTYQPPLAPRSGERTVHDGRAQEQGHSWNRAVIRESIIGSCRRSAWSTFPPFCSDQSSAGASVKLSTVGGRAFPVAGPTIWNSLPDNVISAPSLSTFRQRLKTFLFQAHSLTLSLIPGKLFPICSGS